MNFFKYFYWVAFSSVLTFFSSCNSNDRSFIDIKEVNADVVDYVNIDLWKYKKAGDSIEMGEGGFYSSVYEDLAINYSVASLKRIGMPLFSHDDAGKLIEVEYSDSIAKKLIDILSTNVNVTDCIGEAKKADSACVYADDFKAYLSGINPNRNSILYSQYFEVLETLKQRGHLPEDEYNYLLLYTQLLGSIERMDENAKR